jgi:hypothetical protein
MVHEARLDTPIHPAVCPSGRVLIVAKFFDEAALKNAHRRIAIPIFRDNRAPALFRFQSVRMPVTFRSEQ